MARASFRSQIFLDAASRRSLTRAHLSLSKTPRSTPIAQEVTADESHELVAAFSMTVMLTILLLVIILGATIKHYNITWLHQSGAALLLGTIVGFVVWYVRRDPMYQDNGTGESQRMTSFVEWIMFDTEFFFLVLLPPVIFESGYTLNPETLFRNFDAISVFAFLGTFVSTLVVGFIMYGAGMAGLAYRYTLRDGIADFVHRSGDDAEHLQRHGTGPGHTRGGAR